MSTFKTINCERPLVSLWWLRSIGYYHDDVVFLVTFVVSVSVQAYGIELMAAVRQSGVAQRVPVQDAVWHGEYGAQNGRRIRTIPGTTLDCTLLALSLHR